MIPGIRVIKVGGSLFSWDKLPSSVLDWLARQTPMHNVLLAGGGEFADIVRSADRRFDLGPHASHWICIDLLRATSRLLASLLPDAEFYSRVSDLTRRLQEDAVSGLLIFDPVQFLYEIEPSSAGERLSCAWDTTTDSIAARIAENLKADELVLLKSVTPQGAKSLESLAEQGIVDVFFTRASKSVHNVRVVNLRAAGFDEVSHSAASSPSAK